MMRFNFNRQVRVCAGKSAKVFNKGAHEVDEVFAKTKYFEALLASGDITQHYVKSDKEPLAAKSKAKKADNEQVQCFKYVGCYTADYTR